MAVRSAFSWETDAEYETDPIASGLDYGKRIRQAENNGTYQMEK